ncbi:MAG: tetratricopeptide repeat protein [Deltaproteobacteria bacterium]|nr:tetratricopeptide repeat protein [Deltaproteobacteria bacterium]
MRVWMLVAVLSQVPVVALADDAASKAAALRQKGQDFIRAGDTQAALKSLREAERLDPKNPDNARALAGCLARLGNFPEAAKYYRKFLEVAPPDDPSVPAIRKALQDYETADQPSPGAQSKNPSSTRPAHAPEEPAESAEDADAAKDALARHDVAAARRIAQKELRNGNNAAAIRLFTEIEAQNPKDPDNERALAGAYARSGDYDNAAVHYRKFLEIAPPNDPTVPAIRQALRDYKSSK